MYKFNIYAFDGEGGAEGISASGDGNSLAAGGNRAEGIGPNGETDAASNGNSVSFDQYMKEHKDEASKWFQERFDKRHADYQELKARAKTSDAIAGLLATKYGIEDATDAEAILKALKSDDSLYAERAEANGRTVEEQRKWDEIEAENRRFRAEQQHMQRMQQAQRQYDEWVKQSGNLKTIFPNFDLDTELKNPEFQKALVSGLSMERAFYAIHGDEIVSGAMQYTADAVRKATAEDIAANQNRPKESAIAGKASASVKKDIHNLTRKERADLAKRSMRENIRL